MNQPGNSPNPYADTIPQPQSQSQPQGTAATFLEPVVPEVAANFPFEQQYGEAFNFQFRSPNWLMNVFWGMLAMLSTGMIPIVGQLIFMGYQFRVIDNLVRSNGERFPDFTFDDIEDYFVRGLWAMLASLIPAMIVVPVCLALMGGFAVVVAAIASGADGKPSDFEGLLVVAMMIAWMFAFVVIGIALFLFTAPLALRAGLGKDFGRAMNFGWCQDFVAKMWYEMLLAALFTFVVSMVLMPLGLLMCLIGIYVMTPIMSFMQSHFYYQWYRLYLERGGEPIIATVKRFVPPTASGPPVGEPQPIQPPPKPGSWT